MKEEKLHSTRENVAYMLRNWWNWDKRSVWLCVLRVPALVIMPAVTALIPKLMIDCITEKAEPLKMVGIVAMMSILVACLSWISPCLLEKMNGVAQGTRMKYSIMTFRKAMTTDYENMESIEGREKLEHSKDFSFQGRYSGSQDFYEIIVQICVNVVGIISYIALLYVLHPAIILLIALTCLGEFFLLKFIAKAERKTRHQMDPLWMRYNYLYKNAHDFAVGKDIRLYGVMDWFLFVLAELTATFSKLIGKYTRQTFENSAARATLTLIREAIAYAYLISCVLSGKISVSDFIFYFGIITGFAAWILGLTNQLHNLERSAIECDKFRAFLEMPDHEDGQLSPKRPVSTSEGYTIEFKDVAFQYRGSDEYALKDMSFKVNPGENIAIVGENGAGKTTCIKILCGFYQPTKGEVLVNSVPTNDYNSKEYFKLFSAVYQDYNFLPMSVNRNICLCKEEDMDTVRLEQVLKEAGIWERIQELPEKGETKMIKEVFEKAANFSGGENQKLLLARALYRNAPILVLDEPTAALDPIAENELYEKYSRLTKGKTSFFISHRLSSTRFCDRILFVSDGKITEMGTHEELMANKADYYRMFQIQSHYYRETVTAGGQEAAV